MKSEEQKRRAERKKSEKESKNKKKEEEERCIKATQNNFLIFIFDTPPLKAFPSLHTAPDVKYFRRNILGEKILVEYCV